MGLNEKFFKTVADTPIVPSEHFNTVLYTGNGNSSRSITGVGFAPDFSWIKKKGTATGNHLLQNTVNGAGTNTSLSSNSDSAAGNFDQYGYISAFGADGFTLQAGTSGSYPDDNANEGGSTYVAWNWYAPTSETNTDGTITSTIKKNVATGFSIVRYDVGTQSNSQTIGHGLESPPEIIIDKIINTAGYGWTVYTQPTGLENALTLNSTAPVSSYANFCSVVNDSIFQSKYTSASNTQHIAYCFHSVAGYSKIGSYTGNGNNSGTIVDTGFTPSWLMIKSYSTNDNGGGAWIMYDNKRSTSNPRNKRLFADVASAAQTYVNYNLDFLTGSTKGFQPLYGASGWGFNTLNVDYIYLAIA